jgi:hypothetical protein
VKFLSIYVLVQNKYVYESTFLICNIAYIIAASFYWGRADYVKRVHLTAGICNCMLANTVLVCICAEVSYIIPMQHLPGFMISRMIYPLSLLHTFEGIVSRADGVIG